MPALRSLPLFVLAAAACFATSCGGGNTTTVLQQPGFTPATPIPIPVITTQANFTVVQTADLAAQTNLPPAGGYSGTLQIGGAIQQYAQVTQTLQSSAPSDIAPLSMRPDAKPAIDVSSAQVLLYYGLLFDARTPAYVSPIPSPTDPPPSPVTVTVQVPSSVFVQNVNYYLALYDPQRPSLGWQQKFAGPATVSGTTLTFTSAYSFNRYEQYWLAIFAVNPQAAQPTAAPTISPLVSPSPLTNSIIAIQAIMGPVYVCSGTPCATGNIAPPTQGPVMNSIQTGVRTPSMSGNATQLTIYPSTSQPGDVLYYTPPLVSAPLTTNAMWDFYYYIDQPVWAVPTPRPPATPDPSATAAPTTMMALEFDFNMAMPNYAYNFSSQCLLLDNKNGGPVWQIWGGGTDGWVNSGLACNPANFTPGTWHHLTWMYHWFPDTLQTEYISLTIDGTTVNVPPANAIHPVQKRTEDKTFLEVQFQQDMHQALDPSATPPPFNEWVDNVTLTYW